MKKAFLMCLFIGFAMLSTNCGKSGPEDDPSVQQSKADLISRYWIMKEIKLNGDVTTSNGTTPHQFEKNGDYKTSKDANGNWKYSGKWAFANNETAVKVFVNEPNEQYWEIKSLTSSKMEIEYTPSTSQTFNFTLIAN